MGMDACFWVDRLSVDSYKCRKKLNYVTGPIRDGEIICVGFRVDEGYGENALCIYARDVHTGKVHEFKVWDEDIDVDIGLPEETYGHLVEFFICLKGDCHSCEGPYFKTAPPDWCHHDDKAKEIREKGILFLRNNLIPGGNKNFTIIVDFLHAYKYFNGDKCAHFPKSFSNKSEMLKLISKDDMKAIGKELDDFCLRCISFLTNNPTDCVVLDQKQFVEKWKSMIESLTAEDGFN